MSIVEHLQLIAKEQGTNFKQLEIDCGIGNGVIRRWSTQSPRLDKLVKVANYLNVSLDYLVYGKISPETDSAILPKPETSPKVIKEKERLTCDGSPLKDEEVDLVAMYRLLPSREREDLFDLAYFKYKKHVEKKRESIYSLYSRGSSNAAGGLVEDDDNEGGIG